jgi:hypothetical protein
LWLSSGAPYRVPGCNRSFHALGQADHRASMPIREMGAMADVQSNNPAQRMSLVGHEPKNSI